MLSRVVAGVRIPEVENEQGREGDVRQPEPPSEDERRETAEREEHVPLVHPGQNRVTEDALGGGADQQNPCLVEAALDRSVHLPDHVSRRRDEGEQTQIRDRDAG